MKNFDLPNYKGRSIVNLMSSIGQALGSRSPYPNLKLLSPKELKKSKNIILMIIDGLGYEYLKNQGKGSFLENQLKGKMTSVFPPTTAAAMTTFYTGTAPQQHAYTGWFMYLKEIGIVSTILPYIPRVGGVRFSRLGIKIKDILPVKSFTKKLKVKSYLVIHEKIIDSEYTTHATEKSQRHGYSTLRGYFSQINKIIKTKRGKNYIHAYWPMFDTLCHEYGVKSRKSYQHFKQIDFYFKRFINSIQGTNTTVILTADHGLTDSTKEKIMWLQDHPKLEECLTLPFCGDARTIYCYVHPRKTKQFENYVKTKLNKYCYLYKSEDLIPKKFYGLFKPHPKLIERIGDYALIMKENYVLLDTILKQKRHFHKGNHGGVSKDEMFVPLIVVKC